MIFRFGEHYYLEGISSFWETLFITILGAFVGILGSLYIFRKTVRHDSKLSLLSRESYLKDRLLFLSLLLEDVLETIAKQKAYFLEQGEEIKASPFEISLPKLVVSQHLERIRSIDSQDVFQGFTLLFSDEGQNIEKYKEFLGRLDFIDQRLQQTMISNEKHIAASIALRTKFKNIADNFYSIMPGLIPVGTSLYDKYLGIFNQLLLEKPLNIENFYQQFCVSMFEEIKQLPPTEIVQRFIYEIRKMTTVLDELKYNNLYYVETEILVLEEELQPQLDRLIEFKNEMRQTLRTNR